MLLGHLVCGFFGIFGRDEPRVLLLPTATAANLDFVYVHDGALERKNIQDMMRYTEVSPDKFKDFWRD
jgi:hypothetical protein